MNIHILYGVELKFVPNISPNCCHRESNLGLFLSAPIQ
jgi:hypothetical protein